MISGVGSIDIALLVIAADSGIMPQTLEHLNIIRTLGIERIIVALNKVDLVDDDIIELASDEIRELFNGQEMEQPSIIPVSSVSKSGLGKLIQIIEEQIDEIKPKSVGNAFRMFVDRLFTVKGLGSVVTGSVLSGKVSVGDQLLLLPNQKDKYKVKSIQRHGAAVENAFAGDRAAMNISGLKKEDLQKGSVLSNKIIETTKMIDASLTVFDEKTEMKLWSTVIFYSGTYESLAKIHLLNKNSVSNGEDAIIQIHLEKPVVLLNKDKFIIRKSSADTTIGGGIIIDSQPLHHRKRTDKLIQKLEQLSQQLLIGNQLAQQIESELSKAYLPSLLSEITDRINKPEAEIKQAIIDSDLILDLNILGENAIIRTEDYQYYKNEIIEELKNYHQKYYLMREGISSNFFNGKFKFSKSPIAKKFIEVLFLDMQKEGLISKIESTWVLATHKVVINEFLQSKIDWLEQTYLSYQLQVPIIKDIEAELREQKISKEEYRMVLKILLTEGKLIKYQNEYIHTSNFNLVKEIVLEALKEKQEGITLSEFRQLTSCTKKIIPTLVGLLEQENIVKTKAQENTTILFL